MSLRRFRMLPWVVVALITACVAGTVWHLSWAAALRQVAVRGEADLAQTSDRLIAQLQSYRELSVLLADHPEIEALLSPGYADLTDQAAAEVRTRANQLLVSIGDMTGALRIAALDFQGRAAAISEPLSDPAVMSLWDPGVERAMSGALGRFSGRDAQAARRSFGFASPVFSVPLAPPTGVLVVAINLEAIEAEWRADPTAVSFTDALGEVLVTNRSELALEVGGDRTFRHVGKGPSRNQELWRIDQGGPYLPEFALHIARSLPTIGMRGEVLVDVAPARRVAVLQTVLAALVSLLVAGAVLWILSRRDALALRLEAEEAANEVLERRVAQRTRALSAMNATLRHEVAERKEAEARLKATQDRLVQAGKLSALGEMTAGISHELNQPLMAIRSFAENAELLLERGRTEVVAQNLTRISDLGRRMGRIIRNLRAFARQENAPVRPIDPVAVIAAALEMAEPRLHQEEVSLEWEPPDVPVRVMAGEVRLQQVVMNLISNGLDAMEQTSERRLRIALETGGADVRIVVADNGPGIANADRIFDPFYTTKEVGPSEGMGLGLSISYGLVQSFGGAIEGHNETGGGAVFTVTLPRAAEDVAA